jgi:hypothetical protein
MREGASVYRSGYRVGREVGRGENEERGRGGNILELS